MELMEREHAALRFAAEQDDCAPPLVSHLGLLPSCASELWPSPHFGALFGPSVIMRELFARLARVAQTCASALIEGETGTGKELIARAVHNLSARQSNGFVKLNCAAIPTGLLESELFGHERGAFTGAVQRRIGKFELAHSGTLLLDEIGRASCRERVSDTV